MSGQLTVNGMVENETEIVHMKMDTAFTADDSECAKWSSLKLHVNA